MKRGGNQNVEYKRLMFKETNDCNRNIYLNEIVKPWSKSEVEGLKLENGIRKLDLL